MSKFQDRASRTTFPQNRGIHVYDHDLPESVLKAGLRLEHGVAIDTEATGLRHTDRLCLVQVNFGDGIAHLVRVCKDPKPAPQLCQLLARKDVEKLMHYARFDMTIMYRTWNVLASTIYCTKIASRFARTYTERHGLKVICRELFGIELSKNEQSSYWGAEQLTEAQKYYAASDVMYLHDIRNEFNITLEREERTLLMKAAQQFLPYRVMLDVAGFTEDIFSHTVSRPCE